MYISTQSLLHGLGVASLRVSHADQGYQSITTTAPPHPILLQKKKKKKELAYNLHCFIANFCVKKFYWQQI